MFVISVKHSLIKKIFIPVLICCVLGAVALYRCSLPTETEKLIQSTATGVDNSAKVVEFISGFGWVCSSEPDEIREIIIPVEFNDVYYNYNNIQISQGYDLTNYKGERVKKWTYTITNYPGFENEEYIKINVLVHDGKVIGGDVCSIKLDGFMHGFEKDDSL